jgi:hypothetical protein
MKYRLLELHIQALLPEDLTWNHFCDGATKKVMDALSEGSPAFPIDCNEKLTVTAWSACMASHIQALLKAFSDLKIDTEGQIKRNHDSYSGYREAFDNIHKALKEKNMNNEARLNEHLLFIRDMQKDNEHSRTNRKDWEDAYHREMAHTVSIQDSSIAVIHADLGRVMQSLEERRNEYSLLMNIDAPLKQSIQNVMTDVGFVRTALRDEISRVEKEFADLTNYVRESRAPVLIPETQDNQRLNTTLESMRSSVSQITDYLYQKHARSVEEAADLKAWKDSASAWMHKSDLDTRTHAQTAYENVCNLGTDINRVIGTVNRLMHQMDAQQAQINFLIEKSQMSDATVRPAVTLVAQSDPMPLTTHLTLDHPVPVVTGPELTTADTAREDIPLPTPLAEIVLPTMQKKGMSNATKCLWVLLVFLLTVTSMVTVHLGPREILRICASSVRRSARYIETYSTDKGTFVQEDAVRKLGSSSTNLEIATDGDYVHRRRNPARKQWDVSEDEM